MPKISRSLAISVLASSVLLSAVGCKSRTVESSAAPVVTGLTVAQARAEQTPAGSEAVGNVHAKESAVLSAQVTGRVAAVLVHEGDTVRAGQTLVRLDGVAARADVEHAQAGIAASRHMMEAAQAQASLATSTLARYQVLRDRKSVSPQEYDEIEQRSQSATAQLEAAQAQLSAAQAAAAGARTAAGYSVIAAPFAGVVTARHVDPGALAAPGTSLIEVDRSGPLQLHVTVDESLLRNLENGAAIKTNIPAASQQPLAGRIAEIVPAADSASHSFLVKIDLPPSPSLRAGMYGAASISAGSRQALVIPQAAVVSHGSLNSVWVLDGRHVASIRYIAVGEKRGQDVEVLSGLSAGEMVVLSAGDRELAGKQIEVRP